MGFPKEDYVHAIAELQATVLDRDAKGRNETNDFYSQFPHGVSDLTFELYRRVQRILGAEKIGDLATVYGDTLDLANYAVFLMMLIKTSSANQSEPSVAEPAQSPSPPRDSTALGRHSGCNVHPPAESHAQWCQEAAPPDTALSYTRVGTARWSSRESTPPA